MPVIRFPNFERPHRRRAARRPQVLVGNQPAPGAAARVARATCSATCRSYLHDGSRGAASAPRCSRRATRTRWSARRRPSCPIGQGGTAEFNPVLFNYQSAPGAPAVLTLLATPRGHERDGHRQRARRLRRPARRGASVSSSTRTASARASPASAPATPAAASSRRSGGADGGAEAVDGPAGLNTVMVIQVPLRAPRAGAAARGGGRRRRWTR